MGPSHDDRTEPVLLEELTEAPPAPAVTRLASASQPPPIPTAAPRASTPLRALLAVTSHPPGATVVVVTAGRAQVVGLTPIRTAVDPRLHHDIILAANGYDTVVWRLPPHAPRTIDAYLNLHAE